MMSQKNAPTTREKEQKKEYVFSPMFFAFFLFTFIDTVTHTQGSAKLINRTHAAGVGESFALLSSSSLRIRGECLCV